MSQLVFRFLGFQLQALLCWLIFYLRPSVCQK